MPPSIVAQALRQGLYTRTVGRRVRFYQSTGSTMDDVAELASQGAEEGLVVVAETQVVSRGRMGRRWVSAPGNLYFSVLFRPRLDHLPLLSPLAGVAVARSIRQVAQLYPTIKWPNDIMIEGYKVAGILAESALRGSQVDHAIVGVGINVTMDVSADAEIAATAGSLDRFASLDIDRAELLRRILQHMDALYLDLNRGRSPVPEWRRWLDTLGQHVTVTHQDQSSDGIAEDVDELGNLLLRNDAGKLLTLTAGDITLRSTPNPSPDAALAGETIADA
jgi:BirA family biotin operon repressor/biotin-[acetyl-CoA-carboxylase] ligase